MARTLSSRCRWPGKGAPAGVALLAAIGSAALIAAPDARSTLAERTTKLSRASTWTPVASVALTFRTGHPQGLVRIGEQFVVSSVEIRRPTRRLTPPVDGFDRDTGDGVGHLYKFDDGGRLVAEATLGDGAIYHPGGIDFDGTHIWAPVAEYRPNSRSIIYRIDPQTLRATEMFRFADHIGALVHNTDDNTLHGVSWGSRRYYRWTLDRDGRVTNASASPASLRTLNPSHYVDYQDCKYVGGRLMLCTGVSELRGAPGASPFRLGGIDLVSLVDGRPVHQVPVPLWTTGGLDMTHNAVWVEASVAGLRAYFLPEDDTSTLYVYDVDAR
jgi:hypothetical protein